MTELMRDDHSYPAAMHSSPVDFVPQRVISLIPAMTETLFDLDLGDRLIAVSDRCMRPADRLGTLVRVGDPAGPDLDRIVTLAPDLALMNPDDSRAQDVEALQAAGVAVWMIAPSTVFDALNLLWSLMDVFDHAVMVPRVREIERAYDYSTASSVVQPPARVFVPVWRDPWMTFNLHTFAFDVLRVCGGTVVFGERENDESVEGTSLPGPSDGPPFVQDRRYPVVTLEAIISAQPDVVLLPDAPYGFSEADAAWFSQLDIPAARTGRIYVLDHSLLTWFGTRIAYALRDLPGLLMGAG